jgi:hypothetical protein
MLPKQRDQHAQSGKVCRVAPVPGETKVTFPSVLVSLSHYETKVWQYIILTKRIYLIDCFSTRQPICQGFERVVRVEALPTLGTIPDLMWSDLRLLVFTYNLIQKEKKMSRNPISDAPCLEI